MIAVLMAILLCPAFTYAASDDGGLVGYWKLDDSGVSVGGAYKEEVHNGDSDYWGKSVLKPHPDVNWGNVSSVQGIMGKAFTQSGYKYISPEKFPCAEFDSTKEMTIALWVKSPATLKNNNGTYDWVFGIGPDNSSNNVKYNLICDARAGLAWQIPQWQSPGSGAVGGYVEAGTRTLTMIDKNSVQPDTWYHVMLKLKCGVERSSYNPTKWPSDTSKALMTYECYLNGTKIDSLCSYVDWQVANLKSFFHNAGDESSPDSYILTIGAGVSWGGAATSDFRGLIDDVRIYNNGGMSAYELEGIAKEYKILNSTPANGAEGVSIDTNTITFETDKSVESADFFEKSMTLDGKAVSDVTASGNVFTATFNPWFDYLSEYSLEAPVFGKSGEFGKILSFKTEKPPVYATKNSLSISAGTGDKSASFNYESREGSETALIIAHTLNGRVLNGKVDIDSTALAVGSGSKDVQISVDSAVENSEISVFNWRLDKLWPITYSLASNDTASGELALTSRPKSSAVTCDVTPAGDKIEFEGTISEGRKQVILALLKPGSTAISEESLCAIKQVKADSDGKFTAELGMDLNGESGYFPYIVSGENIAAPIRSSIYYASKATIQGLVQRINDATDYSQVKPILQTDADLDILYSIGMSRKDYELITDSTDDALKGESLTRIAKKLFADGQDYSLDDYTAMLTVINNAVSLEKLLHLPSSQQADYAKSILEKTDLDLTKCGFEKLSTSEAQWLFGQLAKDADTALLSVDTFKTYMKGMSCVAILNFADWRDVSDRIVTYKSYLEEAAGVTITKTITEDLCSDFATSANTSKFESAQKVVDYINNYVETTTPPSGGSLSGGGGSKFSDISVGAGLIDSGNGSENVGTNAGSAAGNGLSDINDVEWASESIKLLFDKGIVSGDDSGKYNPTNSITRAEFVKMIVTAFGLEGASSSMIFSDVADDAWYKEFVKIAAANGIVTGADGKFSPDDFVTREDVAVIVARAMKRAALKPETADKGDFADIEQAHDYSKESIRYLRLCGVIDGYENNYSPLDECSRAEMACLVANVLKYM